MAEDGIHPCPDFDESFGTRLMELFRWRRDVRHFRSHPVDPALLGRLPGRDGQIFGEAAMWAKARKTDIGA
jgi:hypothetical protein